MKFFSDSLRMNIKWLKEDLRKHSNEVIIASDFFCEIPSDHTMDLLAVIVRMFFFFKFFRISQEN